jgi:hypothetical protein
VSLAPPLATAADIRRHVAIKLAMYELDGEVAARMLAALDAGARPDYPALLFAATWPDPPPVVYHTAPVTRRDVISGGGLAVCQPGQGGNWAPRPGTPCVALQAGQPPGVYVTRDPDERGIWAHWPRWDVWEVRRRALPWRPDRLNPGCWSLAAHVPAGHVALHGTFGPGC